MRSAKNMIIGVMLSCNALTTYCAVTFVNRSNQALDLEFYGAYHKNKCSVGAGSKCTVNLVKEGPRIMQLSMKAAPPPPPKAATKSSRSSRATRSQEKPRITASFSTISPGTYEIIMQNSRLKVEKKA